MSTRIKNRGAAVPRTSGGNPKSIKPSTSMRLSEGARHLLAQLSQDMGISQASVMELAIRKLARSHALDGPSGDLEHTDDAW